MGGTEQRQGARVRTQTVRYGHETSASSENGQDFTDDYEETSMSYAPMTTWPKRQIVTCSFTNASKKRKLRTLLARPQRKLDSSPRPSNANSKKRKSSLSDTLEVDEYSPATRNTNNLPKKQRRRTAKEKAQYKATAANIQQSFPEPRGQPEVWADDRTSLCESLPYYQAFKSGAYVSGGYGHGWLLDNDNDERGYMSDEIVISRFGGGFKENPKTGKMEQEEHQTLASSQVQSLMHNMREYVPVTLIVGTKNGHCPSKMPHRYNVMGVSIPTYIWSEKSKNMNVSRIRIQKTDLSHPSWYSAWNSPLPPADRDYITKATCNSCASCDRTWSQVYRAGWMCLNDDCEDHFLIDGEVCTDLEFNPIWANERKKWPQYIIPPFPLKPKPLIADSNVPELAGETSLACWKGMVCPKCGRCNSRTKWDEWQCFNKACDFQLPVRHTVFPPSALVEKHGFQFEGHAISWDRFTAPVTKRETEWPGFWRHSTYDIPGGNIVSHFHANAVINRQPGGANDVLKALQGSKLGLERFSMGSASAEGLSLVKHFAINYGMPYKYIVSVNSKGFSEAPPVMMDLVNRLTWAGKKVVNDGTYKQFNELLCLGYMEKQSIGYHDDGEKDLGPTIASISIGGEATMTIRMKAKFYFCLSKIAKDPHLYNPLATAEWGTHLYEERVKLTELYKKAQKLAGYKDINKQDCEQAGRAYKTAKAAFLAQLDKEKNKKTAPTILSMELKHGDLVVMHGGSLQERYEHSVTPKGKLRYALTCRYVKPENIPVSEHWKGQFDIEAEDAYDGESRVVV